MFLHREHDPSGPYLIPQTSHSWLAWQIAEHWGNRRFARPSPRAEVLAAVLMHDSGWVEYDAVPSLDEHGRPRTFDRMEVGPHLDIWRRCVHHALFVSRYSALLVASHFASLAELKTKDLLDRGDTVSARSVQVFRAEMERLQAGWEEALSADPRYSPSLRGPGREANATLLASCDLASVQLCAGRDEGFTAWAVNPSGSTEEIAFERVGKAVWRLTPWPLEGERIRLQVEGRRLAELRFDSQDRLLAALQSAPVVRLSFTLQRPSAR